MSDNVDVKFSAETSGAIAGIESVKSQLSSFGNMTQGLISTVGEFKEAIVAAFAFEAVESFIEKISDLGVQVERTAQQLGIGTERVGEFNAAAKFSDSSLENMRNGMARFDVNLQSAARGTGNAAAAFKTLGIDIRDASGHLKDGNVALEEVSEKFSKTADNGNKTAIAVELMGRQGKDLIPILDQGAAGMEHMREVAERTGTLFSEDLVKAMHDTHDKTVELSLAQQGLSTTIFQAVKPAVDSMLSALTTFIEDINHSKAAVDFLKESIQALVDVFKILATAFSQTFDLMETLVADVTIRFQYLGELIKDVATGAFGSLEIAQQKTNEALRANWNDYYAKQKIDIAKYVHDANDLYKQLFVGPNVSAGGAPGSPKPSLGSPGDVEAAKAAAQKEIEAYIAKIDAEQQLDKGHYDLVMSLENQKLARLKQFYGEDSKEYQSELKKKYQIDQQYMHEAEAGYREFYSKIGGAYNSFISGLMSGQQRFKQAFLTGLNQIVTGFLQSLPRMIHGWVLTEQIKTSATVSGNAIRTASDQAAIHAGAASKFAAAIADIKADMAKTYAGVYGFFSPVMGPFAAIPAAASAAVVGGMEALVPSYEVGTPYVPRTGLAMLHEGERVVTKRDNAAGAGGTIHVHMHGNAYGFNDFKGAVMDAVTLARRNNDKRAR